MSLRIAHNVEAAGVARNLRVSSDKLAVSMRRLSSGFRINSAADDAAGLGISEKMRGQIRGLDQANRNVQDGISLLNTMEGALNEVSSILQRARELAVQYSNNTISWADKGNIQKEFNQLSNEVARIAKATTFNGINLLQGGTSPLTLQVGANQGEIMTISLPNLFGATGTLVRPNTFFSVPWLPADIQGFDLHITDVAAARGRIGAMTNRLEYTLEQNQRMQEQYMSAESRIRDVDMASEMTQLTKQRLLQQTGMVMLRQANQSPARVLDLLRD